MTKALAYKSILAMFFVLFFQNGVFSQRLNRLNKKGQRTGRWVVYLDSAKTIKSMEGRFRKGEQVGKVYWYTMQGVLERKEINRFRRLKTTIYYPDGAKRLTGKARLEDSPEKTHYYFYGTWRYYDENGKLLKYCYYKKGHLLKTVYADKNNKTNDSLINALNTFEKHFLENNQDLISQIDASKWDPAKSEKLRTQLIQQDSELFSELDAFLNRFGYPSVKTTGESSSIPFFIISYSTTGLREKYLELFQEAVTRGDLEAKTLAFYIDKLKIAKGEQQVYGTQFYLDQKTKKIMHYPSIDPDNLEKRRTAVGL